MGLTSSDGSRSSATYQPGAIAPTAFPTLGAVGGQGAAVGGPVVLPHRPVQLGRPERSTDPSITSTIQASSAARPAKSPMDLGSSHNPGADSTHHLLSGAGHGRLSLDRRPARQWTSRPVMTLVTDFLDRRLRG